MKITEWAVQAWHIPSSRAIKTNPNPKPNPRYKHGHPSLRVIKTQKNVPGRESYWQTERRFSLDGRSRRKGDKVSSRHWNPNPEPVWKAKGGEVLTLLEEKKEGRETVSLTLTLTLNPNWKEGTETGSLERSAIVREIEVTLTQTPDTNP